MFNVNYADIEDILKDYNIHSKIEGISELQRYDYECNNSSSKEVRLIVKVDLEEASPIVIRFKKEKKVTIKLVESQSQFAEILQKNGIITPTQYQTQGRKIKG